MLKVVFDTNVIVSAALYEKSLHALLLCRFRERGSKGAPLIRGTRDGNVPIVGSGDSPCQTESQTDARGRSTLITSVESIKNAGEIIWRYAKASIFDSDGDVSFTIL
jgi:hypothetical protein